ncbi:MAG: GIY-YIG nuclease family protein [Bacteroidetes bacterium]|nr:GIY-YIG nuclease family protein [Bacteroidota bacterium]
MQRFYVYIMSNYNRTVFYTGMTNDIIRRVAEHKEGEGYVFTSTYKCYFLLYYEEYTSVVNAIGREKQLKKWLRKWKIEMIQKENPEMKDLSADWYD